MQKSEVLLNLAKYSSLLVLMCTHFSHLLEESRMCGGQCLKGMHKGAKFRSQYGDGRLEGSKSDW